MARNPQQNEPQQPQQQSASGLASWELERLSTTGRHFLLEPESRSGIVQELQLRLQVEQRKRRELLLMSGNNASQNQPSDEQSTLQQPVQPATTSWRASASASTPAVADVDASATSIVQAQTRRSSVRSIPVAGENLPAPDVQTTRRSSPGPSSAVSATATTEPAALGQETTWRNSFRSAPAETVAATATNVDALASDSQIRQQSSLPSATSETVAASVSNDDAVATGTQSTQRNRIRSLPSETIEARAPRENAVATGLQNTQRSNVPSATLEAVVATAPSENVMATGPQTSRNGFESATAKAAPATAKASNEDAGASGQQKTQRKRFLSVTSEPVAARVPNADAVASSPQNTGRPNSLLSATSATAATIANEDAEATGSVSTRRNSLRSAISETAEGVKAATATGALLTSKPDSFPSTSETTAAKAIDEDVKLTDQPGKRRNSTRSAISETSPTFPVPQAPHMLPDVEPMRIFLPTQRHASVRSANGSTAAVEVSPPSPPAQPSVPQEQPTRSTPPCLQCLMRCLQNSGLLGSCWTAAVFELEEAFAIKQVADAAVGRGAGGPGTDAGGESKQQQLLPSSLSFGVSSGEGSTASQLDASKWQALERLCVLRNSLRNCCHAPGN